MLARLRQLAAPRYRGVRRRRAGGCASLVSCVGLAPSAEFRIGRYRRDTPPKGSLVRPQQLPHPGVGRPVVFRGADARLQERPYRPDVVALGVLHEIDAEAGPS